MSNTFFWPEGQYTHPGEGFKVEVEGWMRVERERKLSKVGLRSGTDILPIGTPRKKRREVIREVSHEFSERAVEHFEKKGLRPKKREGELLQLKEVQLSVPFYYAAGLELLFEKARGAFSSPSLARLCRELRSQPQLIVSPKGKKQKKFVLGRVGESFEKKDVAEIFEKFQLGPSKRRTTKRTL